MYRNEFATLVCNKLVSCKYQPTVEDGTAKPRNLWI